MRVSNAVFFLIEVWTIGELYYQMKFYNRKRIKLTCLGWMVMVITGLWIIQFENIAKVSLMSKKTKKRTIEKLMLISGLRSLHIFNLLQPFDDFLQKVYDYYWNNWKANINLNYTDNKLNLTDLQRTKSLWIPLVKLDGVNLIINAGMYSLFAHVGATMLGLTHTCFEIGNAC